MVFHEMSCMFYITETLGSVRILRIDPYRRSREDQASAWS